MCGILGRTGAQTASFAHAFNTMAHRGPDGSGTSALPGLHSAHCRLAIIDVSDRGLQPMQNSAGTLSIVFNGEIYNYRELRAGLQARGHTFRTETDTEVILEGYAAEGTAFFARLRGMWSFALYDLRTKRVVLSLDYFGIKPLLWSTAGGELSFASEMRAMKTLLQSLNPNTEQYYQFFNLGYFINGETCYQEVKRMLPGEILIWDVEKKTMQKEQLPPPSVEPDQEPVHTFDAAVTTVERALTDSVHAHFVADVPVGLLLSGGNDSSLIAALAAHGGRKPIAYTLEIEGSIDAEYARKVAEHLQLPHERIPMTRAMFEEGYNSAWHVIDEPFADSSIIPTSLIYRAMKGKTKVVLSGEGGDELFGGYTRHRVLAPLSHMSARGLGDMLRAAYGTSAFALSTINPVLSRTRRLLESTTGDLIGTYLSLVRIVDFPIATAHIRALLAQQYAAHLRDIQAHPPALFFDRALYLPHDLLYKTDMASMASSIEARVPFLDKEIRAVLGRIDPAFCLSPEYTDKVLLKKIAEKYLPQDLVYRPKKGFGFSHETYALETFVQDVEAALTFHAAHAATFGLADEALSGMFAPARARVLVAKYPVFAFALVSNWKIFK